MDRWRATLILIAVLALENLVGVSLLREAWLGRQNEAASVVTPAAGAEPAVSLAVGESSSMQAGI